MPVEPGNASRVGEIGQMDGPFSPEAAEKGPEDIRLMDVPAGTTITVIDCKYEFMGWKRGEDGIGFTEEDGMVFLAKDDAVPAMLRFYYQECERLGASKEHLAGIHGLIIRVEKWRERNPQFCKVPD